MENMKKIQNEISGVKTMSEVKKIHWVGLTMDWILQKKIIVNLRT